MFGVTGSAAFPLLTPQPLGTLRRHCASALHKMPAARKNVPVLFTAML